MWSNRRTNSVWFDELPNWVFMFLSLLGLFSSKIVAGIEWINWEWYLPSVYLLQQLITKQKGLKVTLSWTKGDNNGTINLIHSFIWTKGESNWLTKKVHWRRWLIKNVDWWRKLMNIESQLTKKMLIEEESQLARLLLVSWFNKVMVMITDRQTTLVAKLLSQ